MEEEKDIIRKLEENSSDGKINCAEARKIAEELNVAPEKIGEVCDKIKIKIKGCELGCF